MAARKRAAPSARRKTSKASRSKSPRRAARPTRSGTSPRAARGRSEAPRRPKDARPASKPARHGFVFQHMDYTTHALDEVRRFYTELLGFSDFSHDERFQYLTVTTGPSSSLGFMPPLPGPPEQWRPPREPVIFLRVADVDRIHRHLASQGVAFDQAPMDMPDGGRMARLRDPEGRMVCLANATLRAGRKGVET